MLEVYLEQGLPADEVHRIKDGDGNNAGIALMSRNDAEEYAAAVGGAVVSDESMPKATAAVVTEPAAAEESYVKTEIPDFDAELATLPLAGEIAGGEASSSSSQLPIAGRQESEAKGNNKPNRRITYELNRDGVNSEGIDEGA